MMTEFGFMDAVKAVLDRYDKIQGYSEEDALEDLKLLIEGEFDWRFRKGRGIK